ncbi:polysaccharide lyase 8 family protein [Pedobacter arcticus]|uniref:polysaccharide lyase 8 family protein n=1 Tax=Pedobacter arcticus TaxID=752140 RepID=UPI000306C97A|nr:polysaccharide lyase 8 family protein [Pedobacter arcticus]
MKIIKMLILAVVFMLTASNSFAQQLSFNDDINTDSLRKRCYDFITGGAYTLKDPLIKSKIELISQNALNTWKKGFVSDTLNRKTLWKDLKFETSADITTCYTRLLSMTTGFTMQGTAVYQDENLRNDIINALDWLYANKFNERMAIPKSGGHNNWWDYRIGSPDRLCNIMVMMYDKLSVKQRENYLKTISYSTPSVSNYTGANLLWVSRIIILNGILSGNTTKIKYARDAIKEVFEYVKTGDGFYNDGSFIQHNKHPYAGGYGAALLGSLAELMYLLPSIKAVPSSENVYHWVYDSFVPLIYKGGMMSMSMGREISRSNVSEHRKGRSVIEAMVLLANTAPPQHTAKIKSLVKTFVMEDNSVSNYYSILSSITMIRMVKAIVEDKSIPILSNQLLYKQFANMDRAVQHTLNYAFAVSMHSSRIYNFESINEENLKGWHTSDGMTYLYTADQKQFEDHFWPTINYQRLPGTTIVDNSKAVQNKTNGIDWVGGASMQDKYGVTGMHLAPFESSLSAKKSWFMFDNEIVALGAGITYKDKQNVVTTIEQRRLSKKNTNIFTINGEVMPQLFNVHKRSGIQWAHLEGNVPASDVGYYFPGGAELNIERKVQTGSWKDLRPVNSDKEINNNYVTLWKDHGSPVEDTNSAENTYSYALLPGFSQTRVKQYNRNPEIEILENTSSVQAVRDNKLNLLAANFWTDSIQTIAIVGGQPYLTVNKKTAVMVLEESNRIIISLSDPTMKNESYTELEIHCDALEVLKKDPHITIKQISPVIKLSVDMKNLQGRTVAVEFSKKK